MKIVPPAIDSVSFNCPHCGAHADQTWFEVAAKAVENHQPPFRFDLAALGQMQATSSPRRDGIAEDVRTLAIRTTNGDVFFSNLSSEGPTVYCTDRVINLSLSRCYSCGMLSVWVDRRVVYPTFVSDGVPPNGDLPQDVVLDFNEARAILSLSPRGAAALLRLCVQKLCIDLGELGENLNTDIASLVAKGLDIRIQQALDIVRVIGNESVHPGQIDLRDDPATAARLFELVNLIAERMISEPKRIAEMFDALPDSKKRAIADRDKPKL